MRAKKAKLLRKKVNLDLKSKPEYKDVHVKTITGKRFNFKTQEEEPVEIKRYTKLNITKAEYNKLKKEYKNGN